MTMLVLFCVRAASMGSDHESGPLMVPEGNSKKRLLLAKYGCVSFANVLASKKVIMTKDNQDIKY